jgi:drug/metabolite transporter (DMT)-like permease
MIVTGLCFVAVTAMVKYGASELPAAQSGFLRFFFGLIFFVPIAGQLARTRLSAQEVRLITVRGIAHSVGVILWFYAMTRITIAEVVSMNYLVPVYVTLGAALFLGETLVLRRILAVLVAFCGALLILRPGFREIADGHVAMLGTGLMLGLSYVVGKRLSDDLSPAVIVGMLSLSVTIGSAPFAFAVWRTPTPEELFWLFLVATFATAAHYAMTLAFRAAPVAITQPVTFLQLFWATLVGWLYFGEAVDPWVVSGGTLILASVSFLTIREAVLKRQAARLAP